MMKKRTKLRRVSQRWIFIQTLSKFFLLLIFTQYLFWCLREYTDVNVYLNIIQKLSNIHAIFILIFKRRIKLFWVVGCKLWPGGGQPFQQIWPKFATKIKYPWQFDLKYSWKFEEEKTSKVPTRVVTTVPAKEPRLDQQPIKSALKKVSRHISMTINVPHDMTWREFMTINVPHDMTWHMTRVHDDYWTDV